MSGVNVGERLDLVTDGTSAGAVQWKGGNGILAVSSTPSGTNAAFEVLLNDSTWVPVKDNTGTEIAITNGGAEMWNFSLPECRVRISGTIAGIASVVAVGHM